MFDSNSFTFVSLEIPVIMQTGAHEGQLQTRSRRRTWLFISSSYVSASAATHAAAWASTAEDECRSRRSISWSSLPPGKVTTCATKKIRMHSTMIRW